MQNPERHHLPRLERRFYQSFAAVHWTMTVLPPVTGWLDKNFHSEFRELLVHGCARERLFCPAYCLMPDHLHLMLLGLAVESDQLNAVKFLRVQLNRLLAGEPLVSRGTPASPSPWSLQPEAYDHVLKEEERKQNAFARVCFYILANPVRAELVKHEWDWPFSGTVLPGYPDLHPSHEGFWELFWKIYYKHREPTPTEPPKLN
jgi:putative transposase